MHQRFGCFGIHLVKSSSTVSNVYFLSDRPVAQYKKKLMFLHEAGHDKEAPYMMNAVYKNIAEDVPYPSSRDRCRSSKLISLRQRP